MSHDDERVGDNKARPKTTEEDEEEEEEDSVDAEQEGSLATPSIFSDQPIPQPYLQPNQNPNARPKQIAGDDDTEAPPVPGRHREKHKEEIKKEISTTDSGTTFSKKEKAQLDSVMKPEVVEQIQTETKPTETTVAKTATTTRGAAPSMNPDSHIPPSSQQQQSSRLRKKEQPQLAAAMEPAVTDQAHTEEPHPPKETTRTTTTTIGGAVPSTTTSPDIYAPPLSQQQASTVFPGAFPQQGPGLSAGRNRVSVEDERSVMTPFAAEVVEDAPLAVAVPEPDGRSWTHRNRKLLIGGAMVVLVIAVAVLVTLIVTSGSDDDDSPSTVVANPTADTSTAVPTTRVPTNRPIAAPSPPTTEPAPATSPSFSAQWKQIGQAILGEEAEDVAGSSVAISTDGTTIAIGSPWNDGNGLQSGHVRLYRWNSANDRWIQVGGSIESESVGDSSGFSVSLSANGGTVAIGAPANNGKNGENSGHVRVYRLTNDNEWAQVGSDLDGKAAFDQSGVSVSLSDDGAMVAMGAHAYPDSSKAGYVHVYRLDGDGWVQVGDDIDGENPGDWSGTSVSLSAEGTTVAIGAWGNDGNGRESGHVRVYRLDENEVQWNQLGIDLDGEAANDQAGGGTSVSLSADGDTVAIGGPNNNGNGLLSGHVRVYSWDGDEWVQVGSDIDGKLPGDETGLSVSLSADGATVAIGVNHDVGSQLGHVRVHRLEGNGWVQVGSDIFGEAAGDYFGYSVSLSGDGTLVAIGAPLYDEQGQLDAGNVRVFRLEEQ